MMTDPSAFRISTLCGVPAGSWLSRLIANALSAGDLELLLVEGEVQGDEVDDRGVRRRATPAGPASRRRPSRTSSRAPGVALGSGLKAGSRQPLNVRTLPSAPMIGSLSSAVAARVLLRAGRADER